MNNEQNARSLNSPTLFLQFVTIACFILYLNFFLFHSLGSVAFGLISIGFFVFLSLMFGYKSRKTKKVTATVSTLLTVLAFSGGVVVRANPFISTLLVGGVVIALTVYTYILASDIPLVRSLFELVLSPFLIALTYVKTVLRTLKMVVTGRIRQMLPPRPDGKSSVFRSMIVGLILGSVAVGILLTMLSNADPIFASFIQRIVSDEFLRNLYPRIIISLLLAVVLVPFIFLKRTDEFRSPFSFFKSFRFVPEMSVVMSLVAVVIAAFLVIQWKYIFASVPFETNLSQFGVATYSEYVRKGFTELLKVALFIYILIWSGLIVMRENTDSKNSVLRWIQFVVLVEFVIFILSIFRRVWLYQQYHGWTIVRIYGSFFLVWVSAITLFLALRHFWQKRWVVGEIAVTVLILATVGLMNVEQFIVTTHPPTVNKRIDYVYLSRMSADGYEGWLKSYTHAQETLGLYSRKSGLLTKDERREISYAGKAVSELLDSYQYLVKDYGTSDEQKQYLLAILDSYIEADRNPIVSKGASNQKPISHFAEIASLRQKIVEGNFNRREIFRLYNLNKYGEMYDFTQSYGYLYPTFYNVNYYETYQLSVPVKDKKSTTSQLDHLYVWNMSKSKAYERMKSEIPLTKLISLEKIYFALYRKILEQPANEHGFGMDISLSSPFLE